MPKIKPIREDLIKYAQKRNILKKLNKQISIFEENPSHPSLNTEILSPKKLRLYSFRIDRKYRAIFIYRKEEAEIIDINDHYE